MFIAHLPSGYLLGRCIALRTRARLALAVGAIAPDFDLLAFYFWDAQTVHHHTYLTHRPLFWVGILIVGFIIAKLRTQNNTLRAFGIGGLLHLALDTIAGSINWGWPWFDLSGPLVVVPATQSHWILSFLIHWTFAVELIICFTAYMAWHHTRTTKNPGQ